MASGFGPPQKPTTATSELSSGDQMPALSASSSSILESFDARTALMRRASVGTAESTSLTVWTEFEAKHSNLFSSAH